MAKYKIERQIFKKHYIIGTLYDEQGNELCVTLENRKKAIPCGLYDCKQHIGTKYPSRLLKMNDIAYVWVLSNKKVPIERGILMHNGNDVCDTDGCVLVGEKYLEYKNMITNSVSTIKKLYVEFPAMFNLEITRKKRRTFFEMLLDYIVSVIKE